MTFSSQSSEVESSKIQKPLGKVDYSSTPPQEYVFISEGQPVAVLHKIQKRRKCWIWGLRSWELKDNVGKGSIHTSPEERIAVSIILLLLLFLSVLTGSCFQICFLLWSETLDPGEWRFKHFVEVVGYHSQPTFCRITLEAGILDCSEGNVLTRLLCFSTTRPEWY